MAGRGRVRQGDWVREQETIAACTAVFRGARVARILQRDSAESDAESDADSDAESDADGADALADWIGVR